MQKPTPTIQTERLILRAPAERDIPAWFARATDREAASLAGDPVPDDVSAGQEWLARSRRQVELGTRFQWSIDRTAVEESIGTISLSISEPALSFVLSRAHWGHGLATEAARELLRYGFDTFEFPEVVAEVASRNAASLRVLAKLGFRSAGRFTDEADGELCERLCLKRPHY
ncbi:MAG: GNAT family N-acetyltransferase [Bosea sp. (in: a-proteobacteria)]